MDLGAIQTALTSWFQDLSGLEADWYEEPYFVRPEPFALLAIGEIAPSGIDEAWYSYDDDTDYQTVQMAGLRTFVLHVRVRAFDQRQTFAARQQMETARLRMQRHSSIADLNAAGLALVRTGPVIEQTYTHDDRRISQIMVDITFQTRAVETDDTFDGEYIGRVTGDGTYDPDPPAISTSIDTALEA